jgi:hypothetical protein
MMRVNTQRPKVVPLSRIHKRRASDVFIVAPL